MLNRLKLFFQLFQAGKTLKDRTFWGRQQAYVIPVVVSVFVLCINLAQSFGITVPVWLDQNLLTWVAGALYMLVNTCLTIFQHEHLGMPSGTSGEAQQAVPEPSATRSDQEQPIVPPSPVSGPSSRFDEDTLARANEWLQRQRLDDKPGGVFYSP